MSKGALVRNRSLPKAPSLQAELIVRLEEIVECDYSDLDVETVEQIQEDMQALALAMLCLFRREDNAVFGNRHIFLGGLRCMSCGVEKDVVDLSQRSQTCSGAL